MHALVLLHQDGHRGEAVVERVSEGQAAVTALRALIAATADSDGEAIRMRMVEVLGDVVAWRVRGAEPAALARALERAAA